MIDELIQHFITEAGWRGRYDAMSEGAKLIMDMRIALGFMIYFIQ